MKKLLWKPETGPSILHRALKDSYKGGAVWKLEGVGQAGKMGRRGRTSPQRKEPEQMSGGVKNMLEGWDPLVMPCS